MMQPDFVARKLLNTALELFREDGYSSTELSQIAERAGCSLDELYRRFPHKKAFIMGLYERFSQELQTCVVDAPTGTVADRFEFLMRKLLATLEPHRPILQQLLPAMLDPENRLGVLGPATNRIREEVQGVYRLLVLGSKNPPASDKTESLVQFLYFSHLGLIFLFLQEQSNDRQFFLSYSGPWQSESSCICR